MYYPLGYRIVAILSLFAINITNKQETIGLVESQHVCSTFDLSNPIIYMISLTFKARARSANKALNYVIAGVAQKGNPQEMNAFILCGILEGKITVHCSLGHST